MRRHRVATTPAQTLAGICLVQRRSARAMRLTVMPRGQRFDSGHRWARCGPQMGHKAKRPLDGGRCFVWSLPTAVRQFSQQLAAFPVPWVARRPKVLASADRRHGFLRCADRLRFSARLGRIRPGARQCALRPRRFPGAGAVSLSLTAYTEFSCGLSASRGGCSSSVRGLRAASQLWVGTHFFHFHYGSSRCRPSSGDFSKQHGSAVLSYFDALNLRNPSRPATEGSTARAKAAKAGSCMNARVSVTDGLPCRAAERTASAAPQA